MEKVTAQGVALRIKFFYSKITLNLSDALFK